MLASVLFPTLGRTCDRLLICAHPTLIRNRTTTRICSMLRTRLWVTAETAVKCADHSPRLIDQATKTLENALRRDGMLD